MVFDEKTILIIGLAFCAGVLLPMLFFVLSRVSQRKRQASLTQSPAINFSELAILFQTMRGLIDDQKTLAKEFNKSVDRKVAVVREVVRLIVEEHDRLSKVHQELSQKLDETRAELARLKNPETETKSEVVADILERQENEGESVSTDTPIVPVLEQIPALHALMTAKDAGSADDLIDSWVGVDLAEEEAGHKPVTTVVVTPSSAELEQNHDAMQALLYMGEKPPNDVTPSAPLPFPGPDTVKDRLNGVRARAFKFHDAGMSISEIAQELGIGKGEVRLMLNLREKAE